MAKPENDAREDLSLDIADAVGKTIGNIVNEIESLDKRKAELIQKLSDARDSLNEQFNKWLPTGLTASVKAAQDRAKNYDKPCKFCGFKTEPYHDARLKMHRDQINKKALTDSELAAAGMRRI